MTPWYKLPPGPERAAKKAASSRTTWPAWKDFYGPEAMHINRDVVVSMCGKWVRKYRYHDAASLEFAKLVAQAGLPREICDLPITINGDGIVAGGVHFNRYGSARDTRATYVAHFAGRTNEF
jgi:hypothetical protein